MTDELPQRGQQFIDKDLMLIALSLGLPVGKAAELVGNVLYESGARGVHTLVYGDLRSQVGEAHLRNFVRAILTTYPSKFERELHALAKQGDMVAPVDPPPPPHLQPSDEYLARIREKVRGSF